MELYYSVFPHDIYVGSTFIKSHPGHSLTAHGGFTVQPFGELADGIHEELANIWTYWEYEGPGVHPSEAQFLVCPGEFVEFFLPEWKGRILVPSLPCSFRHDDGATYPVYSCFVRY